MYHPDFYDPARFGRSLVTSHRVSSRVELWSEGKLLTESAPFTDGAVADKWVTAGVRRTLDLTVPPSRDWLRWLQLPLLEARPFRGIVYSRAETVECPLGRFPLLPPEMSDPVGPVKVTAEDYYQAIIQADFSYPVRVTDRSAVGAVKDLITNWSRPFAGVRDPVITSSETGVARGTVYDKTRHDAVVMLAKSFGLEVFWDREGVPTIADARGFVGAQTDLRTIGTESVVVTPDRDRVFNQVAVSSSAQDVNFRARVATVTETHPAAQWRIRPRVYKYSSPLIMNPAQAEAAARSILAKVSAPALTHRYTCVPDPRRDAGDSVAGVKTGGGSGLYMIADVTHPLTAEGRQTVTTVSTQQDVE